jgi:predicted ATPase/DNA-binding SARP family transcriptional activator
VEFRVLGPLEVADGERAVDLGGPRERALLVRLLISANLVVSADRLAEDLWSGEPPAHWLPTLRVYVSRLRRALGAGAVLTEPPGYRLGLAAGQLDADAFARLVAAARRDLADGRAEAAAAGLRRALGLWRGPALSGVADLPFARADAARLEEARLSAVEDWVEAELGCGNHAGMAAELDGLVTSYPLRERLRGQRMRALYRCGRQADALRAYQELRAYLSGELGLEPAAALRDLQSAILRQDPALDWQAPPPAALPVPPVPASPEPVAWRPGSPAPPGRAAGWLPAEITSFVGREADLAAVGKLLAAGRLVTLTGPGGSGKTRLARQAGAAVAAGYPDGVWLVDLAPIGDQELVASAVAATLAVREEPGRPLTDSIAGRLRNSEALLIADNCEHVVGAAAGLAAALLAACPALRILATSQTRLGVPGEAIWPVPPLSVPPSAASGPADVAEAESVRLLCDRAALARPGFSLTAGNAADIGEICRRLDGIPLAIELAAARLGTLTPAQLAARLGNRFGVLTGGSRTALARHRTLRAAISWSHELLDEREQTCLRRMAVFAGGCTIDAAEAVCADASLPAEAVLEAVASLVDRSLLTTEERCGSMRYGMLESVRQYAREQLIEAGEYDQLSRRHLAWLLDLAGRADLDGADQSAWLDLLEADHGNFRAGLEWALTAPQADSALALAGDLAAFWVARGHLGEGRRWLAAALGAAAAQDDPRARATALDGAAQLAHACGDFPAQQGHLRESLGIWRGLGQAAHVAHCLSELGVVAQIRGDIAAARPLLDEALESASLAGDQRQIAMALNGLGRFALQDDPPRAAACFEEALACIRQVGDLRRTTIILGNLAIAIRNQGRIIPARATMEEQLACARELGDRTQIGAALTNLGLAAAEAGDLGAARASQDEALRLAGEIGDRRLETYALGNSALVCRLDGDYPAARAFHRRALRLGRDLGEPGVIAVNLEELASVEAAEANFGLAACLLGAAQALRERLGEPLAGPDLPRHDQVIADVRGALGDERYQANWDRGRSMPEQEMVTLAVETPGMPSR